MGFPQGKWSFFHLGRRVGRCYLLLCVIFGWVNVLPWVLLVSRERCLDGDVPLCRYDGPGCAMGVEPWGTKGQDYVSPCPLEMMITLSPFIRQRLFCAF